MPLVSIIIYNRNNALYLEHSLRSVLGQTLSDIEAICIDDASTDDSLEVMKRVAAQDPRLRICNTGTPKGCHASRAEAVALSSGDFVMFLNSGDYFAPTACEKGRLLCLSGCDVGSFGVNVLPEPGETAEARSRSLQLQTDLNRWGGKAMSGAAVVNSLCGNNAGRPTLVNRCIAGELARSAFADMKSNVASYDFEAYELLTIANLAHAADRITERLYWHRPWLAAEEPDISPHSEAEGSLAAFCSDKGLERYGAAFHNKSLADQAAAWVEDRNLEAVTKDFDAMASRYGVISVIEALFRKHRNRIDTITKKYTHYARPLKNGPIKHIGIFYSILKGGGAEAVIINQANLLVRAGFRVTLFLRYGYPADSKIDSAVRVVYLNNQMMVDDKATRLIQLYKYLEDAELDVMFFHEAWDYGLLWHVMLLKYLSIPSILVHHSAYFTTLYKPSNTVLETHNIFCRIFDKVICLSRYGELYMRINGIDAHYIGNPVRQCVTAPECNLAGRGKNIAFLGRLAEPIKQPEEALKILKECVAVDPEITMTFIGSFVDDEKRKQFLAIAQQLGIADRIQVTGWTENPAFYLDKAAILVSTSWSEGFPLAIGEAQARGLPVVMYQLAIELARNNDSIIMVPQLDYKSAAKAITGLLGDEERWLRLSCMAAEMAKQYAPERHLENLVEFLDTIGRFSHLHQYSREDYRVIMRTLAFYGAHIPPWLEQAK